MLDKLCFMVDVADSEQLIISEMQCLPFARKSYNT